MSSPLLAAKLDETDAASVERFRNAIAGIDEYRSARTTRDDGHSREQPAQRRAGSYRQLPEP